MVEERQKPCYLSISSDPSCSVLASVSLSSNDIHFRLGAGSKLSMMVVHYFVLDKKHYLESNGNFRFLDPVKRGECLGNKVAPLAFKPR